MVTIAVGPRAGENCRFSAASVLFQAACLTCEATRFRDRASGGSDMTLKKKLAPRDGCRQEQEPALHRTVKPIRAASAFPDSSLFEMNPRADV